MLLRKQGLTQPEIAAKLGVSQPTVSLDLRQAFEAYQKEYEEEAAHFARLDLLRLDSLLASHWENAKADVKAAHLVLKLLERRAKLLGLDAVEKQQIQVMTEKSPAEIKSELEALLGGTDG